MIKSGNLSFLLNKYLLAILAGILFSFLSSSSAYAQTSLPYQPEIAINPQQLSPYSPHIASLAIYNFSHAVSCIVSGSSPIAPCLEYKFTKSVSGATSSVPYLSSINTTHGLLGMSASVIDNLYLYRPLNKGEYLAELGRNIGLINSAQAQVGGGGNAVLSPVFRLWEVTRNIAYLVMIIIFIIVGLMVMFRQKLNPQTVVSIQLALPGLVIGLIMITFSYFLAALITDLAFLGTDLVGYYFQTATKAPNTSLTYALGEENALSIGGHFIGVLRFAQLKEASFQMLNALPNKGEMDFKSWYISPVRWLEESSDPKNLITMMSMFLGYTFGNGLGNVIGGLAGGLAGAAGAFARTAFLAASLTGVQATAGPLLGGIVASYALADTPGALAFAFYFVAVFAILYTLLRLALALINNYLQIIFLTITAPFHFLVSSLPGKQDIAVTWMRNMLCHVLAFPAVVAVFYFAAFMLGTTRIPGLDIGSSPVDLTSENTLPLFGKLDLSLVKSLLAFGAILATPKIPDIICKAIGKPGQAGGVVDQTIMAGIGSGQKYSGQYQAGYGQVGNQLGQSWTKWKGQDPYGSISSKYFARAGIVKEKAPGILKALGPYDTTEELSKIAAKRFDERTEAKKSLPSTRGFWGRLFRRPTYHEEAAAPMHDADRTGAGAAERE